MESAFYRYHYHSITNSLSTTNHHFKWWLELALIKAYITCTPEERVITKEVQLPGNVIDLFAFEKQNIFLRNHASSALRLSFSLCCLAIVSFSVLMVVFSYEIISLNSMNWISLLLFTTVSAPFFTLNSSFSILLLRFCKKYCVYAIFVSS